jgi:hypothetical protein
MREARHDRCNAGGLWWTRSKKGFAFMRVPTAAKILREQYGEAEARKLALRELQCAKRARSRKRFNFWAAVAKSIASDSM